MMKRFMSALIVLLCSIVGVCAQQQGKLYYVLILLLGILVIFRK